MLNATHAHLVGIKGVALASLAQMLRDAGITVTGSDVAEDFVTQGVLEELDVPIQTSFEEPLPANTDLVVYTGAHKGKDNPQVQQAHMAGIPALSHAEALAQLVEDQKVIAVCGVGGKSTTAAMIAWIFSHANIPCSYSVGVGSIPKLKRTGMYTKEAEYAVIEADEYVINPSQVAQGEDPVPRFSFFSPHIVCCSNIEYDHPDVYPTFEHTKKAFKAFLSSVGPNGHIIAVDTVKSIVDASSLPTQPLFCGADSASSFKLTSDTTIVNKTSQTRCNIHGTDYTLTLKIPGRYNVFNALLALGAAQQAGIDVATALEALATFPSTMRRFEQHNSFQGSSLYDDYAHHPKEVAAAIKAFQDWEPDKQRIIAFQPHTFSRTKELFDEFVSALTVTDTVIVLDIFASAREQDTGTISSHDLVEALKKNTVTVLHTENYSTLAQLLTQLCSSDTAVLTIGAGDIYKVYSVLSHV